MSQVDGAIDLRRIKPANQTTKGFDFMSNKKYRNHFLAASLIFGLSFSMIAETSITDAAHRLNKGKVSLRIGTSYKLKVKGRKRTVTWRSSKKKIATVSKKGKVTAKKAGTATITAKIGKKRLRCQVTVIKPSAGTTTTPVTTQKPAVTQKPTVAATPVPTIKPTPTYTQKPAGNQKPVITLKPVGTPKPTVTSKPTSTPKPTTAPGSTVTETSAYQTLNSLRSTYPEGMSLTNSYYYYSNVFGNGYGCYGFAAKLSDTIFGTTKAYTTHSDFSKIRVGDHIRIGNYHSVVCLTKGSDSITVVEGNYNSSVHWDRKITKSSLASEGFKVYTRY